MVLPKMRATPSNIVPFRPLALHQMEVDISDDAGAFERSQSGSPLSESVSNTDSDDSVEVATKSCGLPLHPSMRQRYHTPPLSSCLTICRVKELNVSPRKNNINTEATTRHTTIGQRHADVENRKRVLNPEPIYITPKKRFCRAYEQQRRLEVSESVESRHHSSEIPAPVKGCQNHPSVVYECDMCLQEVAKRFGWPAHALTSDVASLGAITGKENVECSAHSPVDGDEFEHVKLASSESSRQQSFSNVINSSPSLHKSFSSSAVAAPDSAEHSSEENISSEDVSFSGANSAGSLKASSTETTVLLGETPLDLTRSHCTDWKPDILEDDKNKNSECCDDDKNHKLFRTVASPAISGRFSIASILSSDDVKKSNCRNTQLPLNKSETSSRKRRRRRQNVHRSTASLTQPTGNVDALSEANVSPAYDAITQGRTHRGSSALATAELRRHAATPSPSNLAASAVAPTERRVLANERERQRVKHLTGAFKELGGCVTAITSECLGEGDDTVTSVSGGGGGMRHTKVAVLRTAALYIGYLTHVLEEGVGEQEQRLYDHMRRSIVEFTSSKGRRPCEEDDEAVAE